MIRPLAMLLSALLAAPAQDPKDKPDKPAPPAEEFVAIKWDVLKEDRFDFIWKYDEMRKRIPGTGDPQETSDKRDVVGEVWLKVGENGQPNTLVLEIKKALWAVGTRDYDITITWATGKKLDLQQKMKTGNPKAPDQTQKTMAGVQAENMKRNTEGDYAIYFDAQRNATSMLLRGRPCKPGPSLFDKLWFHSPIPNALIRQGQNWREPIDASIMPTGLMEAKDIDYKATAVTALLATFKGALQFPIVKPPTAATSQSTNQSISGNFSVAREFVWNRSGYLQSSKEEVTFTKKVDATGKDAAFYKEDNTFTVKQQLTIKKKPPPGSKDDKPDEKKPPAPKQP